MQTIQARIWKKIKSIELDYHRALSSLYNRHHLDRNWGNWATESDRTSRDIDGNKLLPDIWHEIPEFHF